MNGATCLTMGRTQTLTDDMWKVEILVDDDGHLNIWVTATDDGDAMTVYDSGDDISDDDNQQAFRFVYNKEDN